MWVPGAHPCIVHDVCVHFRFYYSIQKRGFHDEARAPDKMRPTVPSGSMRLRLVSIHIKVPCRLGQCHSNAV